MASLQWMCLLVIFLLKSDQEHVFVSKHMDYVMWFDSLLIKVSDKISIALVVQD